MTGRRRALAGPVVRDRPRPAPWLVLAPPALHGVLRAGLAAAGVAARLRVRRRARTGSDPYGVAALAERWHARAAGVLLVVPRRMPAARAAPSAVLHGLAVTTVHADAAGDLAGWLGALPAAGAGGGWAVLAPGQHHYLRLSGDLRRRLRVGAAVDDERAGRLGAPGVARWTGDRVARAVVKAHLADRPALVLYTGHGLPAGLPAFGGMDERDWGTRGAASGAVALFACRTLAWTGGRPGLAWRLVAEGRAAGVLAAVADVDRRLNSAFARRCAERLARNGGDLAAALVALDRDQPAQAPLRQVLAAYRLVGIPVRGRSGR